MEPQSDEGIHRLELPVSRTTLNSWGGLPMAISEKSRLNQKQIKRHRSRDYIHWAFRKLLTATGWPASACMEVSLNISSACFWGRTPMYFWPRACMCSPMFAPSCDGC